jgi:Restriction endonuclease fold toxin 5
MYDEAARSFGFNPKTARRTPDQNTKVMDRMYTSINDAIAAAKAKGGKTSVEWHSQFRSSLGIERQKDERAQTAKLNQQAQLASMPGASIMSDPTVRGISQRLVAAEIRVLNVAKPELGAAAQTALSGGMVLTLLAAEQLASISSIGEALDNPPPEKSPDQNLLTPLALPLDTDNDGKLQCKEIGDWKTDNANHTANSRTYQDYVSGRPGTDFNVKVPAYNDINFDGCKDKAEGPVLLEAKAKQGKLLDPKPRKFMTDKIADQGQRQHNVATALGVANEWHIQTEKDHAVIEKVLNDKAKLPTPVIYDPTPLIKK